MALARLSLICAAVLVAAPIPGTTCSSQEIRATHGGSADLTGDGEPEHVRVTAVGARWDSLLVRLEIWDSGRQQILYADEWSSKAWCGGPGYSMREGTTEDWVRSELERHADPESFRPGGSGARRFGVGNVEWTRSEIRWDLVDQLWRQEYAKPMHEHARRQHDRQLILDEFRAQVSEAEIDQLLAEFGGRPDFVYHPHWDALYGIAWSDRLGRFVFMLFIG